jgi:hypothetical protein
MENLVQHIIVDLFAGIHKVYDCKSSEFEAIEDITHQSFIVSISGKFNILSLSFSKVEKPLPMIHCISYSCLFLFL